jgi:hypothetical protein
MLDRKASGAQLAGQCNQGCRRLPEGIEIGYLGTDVDVQADQGEPRP